ncbi:MAG: WhiB family transcriptional regulator [Mycobacteriaceae bacterium]
MSTPCRDAPEKWVSDHAAARREAAALCRDCPILTDCYERAMTNRETFGVWGGVDFSDATSRPKFPPKPRPIRHGTEGGHRAHLRRGETPCAMCTVAARDAWKLQRTLRKGAS